LHSFPALFLCPVVLTRTARRREASINDVPIEESQRRIFGPRPPAERGAEFPIR
jgi:nuclear transport factor 2 (NTF2) superfamily protein